MSSLGLSKNHKLSAKMEDLNIFISNLLECADYEVGSGPFTLTAFHDGVDGLTIDWIEVKS